MDAKTLCLGALTLGDATGYEIKKLVEEGCFAHFHASSYGSIYPALAQLSADGAVTYDIDSQPGRPDRKIYRITDAGRQRFRQALRAAPAPDKVRSDAVFMLFFAELLDPAHRERVYEGYLAHYRALIEGMEALASGGTEGQPPAGRRWARGFGLNFYRAAADYLENNRHVLIEAEKDAAGAPGADSVPELAVAGDRS